MLKIRFCSALSSLFVLIFSASAYSFTFSTGPKYIKVGFLSFNPVFSFGECATVLSILATLFVFFRTSKNNREQERKEHEKEFADKIRNSAGAIISKLESRKNINLEFFENIQPIVEETDNYLFKTKNYDKTDSFLLKGLTDGRARICQSIVNEQIEMSFKDLYGYSPVLDDLLGLMNKLEYIDRQSYAVFYRLTGKDIKLLRSQPKTDELNLWAEEIMPFKLAARLRLTISLFRHEYGDLVNGAINPFRAKMLTLINEKDLEIYNKQNILFNYDPDKSMAHCWALKGLEKSLHEKWRESGLFFCRAIRLDPNVPGFWAGAGVALHCLDLGEDTKIASQMVRSLTDRQARDAPDFFSGPLDYERELLKIEDALDRVNQENFKSDRSNGD